MHQPLVKAQKNTEEESPSAVLTTSASKTIMKSLRDHMKEISARSMDI
jgi:CHASE3 domain sensor protein